MIRIVVVYFRFDWKLNSKWEKTTIGMKRENQNIIAQYDAACKELLSQKVILAWIMKGCIAEYEELSVEKIMRDCIEGEMQISKESLESERERYLPLIQGDGGEDTSVQEGRIAYDIRFTAIHPLTGKHIWIDVEPQNDFYPGYSLLKRGLYYLSRMISAQRGREFTGSDYDNVKKVYTIWVCMNPPKKWEHWIKHYGIRDLDDECRLMFRPDEYDLMTQVVICLGDPRDPKAKGVLRLLSVLLTNVYEPEEKEQILREEFKIQITNSIRKGLRTMCNLGEGLYNKAKAETKDRINSLYRLLYSEKRFEDMEKAFEDDVYLEELLKKYRLA